jgi:Ca2+-transporting ATPase
MAIHSGDRVSFFRTWFKQNQLLFWAVLSTFVLQLIVIYVPFMQALFETVPLTLTEMFVSFVLGAVILVAVEIEKVYLTHTSRGKEPRASSAWR